MIRNAAITDTEEIITILEQFANETSSGLHANPNYQFARVARVLYQFMQRGIVLVATDDDNKIVGLLIAGIVEDPWIPEIKILREYAWYVLKSHRRMSYGVDLLNRYTEIAGRMVAKGKITSASMTLMTSTNPAVLDPWQWTEMETTYMYTGIDMTGGAD